MSLSSINRYQSGNTANIARTFVQQSDHRLTTVSVRSTGLYSDSPRPHRRDLASSRAARRHNLVSRAFMKRLLDITLALACGIVFALPMLVIAVIVKVSSP